MIADFILDLANVGWVDESEIALVVESAIAVILLINFLKCDRGLGWESAIFYSMGCINLSVMRLILINCVFLKKKGK